MLIAAGRSEFSVSRGAEAQVPWLLHEAGLWRDGLGGPIVPGVCGPLPGPGLSSECPVCTCCHLRALSALARERASGTVCRALLSGRQPPGSKAECPACLELPR